MATPVGWSYGPWKAQQTSTTPYATVPAAAEVVPGATAGQVSRVAEDWGNQDVGNQAPGITGTSEYGPMTGQEMAGLWGGSLGKAAMGMGVDPGIAGPAGAIGSKAIGLGLNAALGATPSISGLLSTSSLLGMAPRAAMTLASLAAKAFGAVRGTDPFSSVGLGDIQAAQDTYGYGSPQAKNISENRQNAFDAAQALGMQFGEAPAAPSVGNPDMGDLSGYGPSGMGRNDAGGGDTGGRSETGGQGESGNSGMWARGGVSSVRRPTRALYGEGGEPETAIFVPQSMQRPGQQPHESQVEAEMKALLRALRR